MPDPENPGQLETTPARGCPSALARLALMIVANAAVDALQACPEGVLVGVYEKSRRG